MRVIKLFLSPATDEDRAAAAAKEATSALRLIARDENAPFNVRVDAAEAILRHYRHFYG